jgi:5-methylcytosine-specific restriction endonuclease McrA
MEKTKAAATIPLDHIRGLIVAQGGKCAITGIPLDPQEVNADHLIPLSRTELSPSTDRDNIWLVHKSVNTMKGTMTYDELVDMARKVLEHYDRSKGLAAMIQGKEIEPMTKGDFDHWVSDNCLNNGRVKD